MRITIDGACSSVSDLCNTCAKDDTECVFKKLLSNYQGGGDMPLSLMITDCPEYIRTENRNARISWFDFNEVTPRSDSVTFNPNVTVRLNIGETNSGT